jgi:D-aspartate ligase
MKASTSLPAALVLGPPKFIAPLGVMRSLGRMGVRVYGLTHSRRSMSSVSRYCAGQVDAGVNGRPLGDPSAVIDQLLDAGSRIGRGTVLIPASDEWAVLVAAHAAELQPAYAFSASDPSLVAALASKESMTALATMHALPTPRTWTPRGRDQLAVLASRLDYPVIVKPAESRPGMTVKALACNADEVVQWYERMEESPLAPNVCIQEYIPGSDADSWLFNGYFDADGRCIAAFTGTKLRQHPRRFGIASLVVTRHNPELIAQTVRFLAAVGYRGAVDIDYRYDARDGKYKVVDVNPRLGGAFKAFVDESGTDLARVLYLDLTGRRPSVANAVEGRLWVKEDADLVAFRYYRQFEGLTFRSWLRSWREADEGGIFARDDPLPFVVAMAHLLSRTAGEKIKRRGRGLTRAILPAAWRFRSRQGAA